MLAAWVLSNTLHDNAEAQRVVMLAGGVEALVAVVTATTNNDTRIRAMMALEHVACTEDARIRLVQAGAVTAVAAHLTSYQPDVVTRGLLLLSVLSHSEAVRAALAKVESSVLKSHAACCVREAIASGDAEELRTKFHELIDLFDAVRR